MKKSLFNYSLALVASIITVAAYQCPLDSSNSSGANGEFTGTDTDTGLHYKLRAEFSSSTATWITGGEIYIFCDGTGGVDSHHFPEWTSYDFVQASYYKTSYQEAGVTISLQGDPTQNATAYTDG